MGELICLIISPIVIIAGIILTWLLPFLLIFSIITWPKLKYMHYDPINKKDYLRLLTPPLFIWLHFDQTDLSLYETDTVKMKKDLLFLAESSVYFLPVLSLCTLWLL